MKEFNIDRFLELAGGVQIDDLDWELCSRIGISEVEAKVLRYMADTESHTILYMRDLLAGHSTKDPEIVQFLSVWVYEELCHGRAITKLLTATGYPEDPGHYTKTVQGSGMREFVEAALSQMAAMLTPRFIAVHMAWGAINEATAAAAYQMIERHTANPVVATLCNRMARQERRHMAFYYHQANKRMVGDKIAQRFVQFALQRFWTLVGSGVAGENNLDFVAAHLFGTEEARTPLHQAEAHIQKLPGLQWFDMITTQTKECADRYVRSHGPGLYTTNSERASSAQLAQSAQ